MELKSKYLNEQYLFEAQMVQLQHQHNIFMNGGGGGLSSTPTTPPVVITDPNALAFIAATGITDNTQKSAINSLVISLKGYSIWDKLNAIYPFVGGTATTHKFNLKDPRDLDAAYRLSFNGGITHSSNGSLPNGTTGYANTFFNPTTLSSDSIHFSSYYRTDAVGVVSTEFGCVVRTGIGEERITVGDHRFTPSGISPMFYANGGNGASGVFSTVNNLGSYIATRTDNTTMKAFKNGVLANSVNVGSTNANANMFLMGYNQVQTDDAPFQSTLYGKKQIAFATIGAGLTDTEAADLNTSITAFQTTLGRQV
jgi:hypothetical protein